MEQETQQKRQVAYKVCVKDLLEGPYSKEEGWKPNFVSINGKQVARANVGGVVVAISLKDNPKSVTVDDGTGEIGVRVFEEGTGIDKLKVGDCVFIIGRPREYGTER